MASNPNDAGAGFVNALVSPFRALYNWDADSARANLKNIEDQALVDMENALATDTSLKGIMQREGLLNPDGTVNRTKYFDSELFRNQLERIREGQTSALANARAEAARLSMQKQGPVQDLSSAFNVGAMSNKAADQGTRQALDLESNLRNKAENQAMSFGKQAQADKLNEINNIRELASMRANLAEKRAAGEQLGMLQTPEGIMGLAKIGMGVFGNPLSAVPTNTSVTTGVQKSTRQGTSPFSFGATSRTSYNPGESVPEDEYMASTGFERMPDYTQGWRAKTRR